MSRRALATVATVAVCVLGAAVYVAFAAFSADGTTSKARPKLTVAAETDVPPGARLLVRAVDWSNPRLNGRLYETTLRGRPAIDAGGDLACERVHANAAGEGLCLTAGDSGLRYHAVVFGPGYEPGARFSIPGVPDRARVSRDGRYAAYTAFLSGHTYSASGVREFTVHTAIVDMRAGEELLSLDELEITRAGEPFDHHRSNLWGVTFAGGDRFYATLGVDGHHYLIEGRIGTRSARIVRDGVECPSLSPDGTRIAYKRRIGTHDRWRLRVLDLRSGRDVALAERRSIDDQPEWLGDGHVVYSDDESVFSAPADGSGRAERLVARASSPVGLR